MFELLNLNWKFNLELQHQCKPYDQSSKHGKLLHLHATLGELIRACMFGSINRPCNRMGNYILPVRLAMIRP